MPLALFVVWEAKQESLHFGPAELVVRHSVCGPMKESSEGKNILPVCFMSSEILFVP